MFKKLWVLLCLTSLSRSRGFQPFLNHFLRAVKLRTSYSFHLFSILSVWFLYSSQAIAEKEARIESPYFWKVEKDGKTSYLLGTLHESVFIKASGETAPLPALISHKHKHYSIDNLPCSNEIQYHLENSDLLFVENDSFTEKSKEVATIRKQRMLSKDGGDFQALSTRSQEFFKSAGIHDRWNLYGYVTILYQLCDYGFADLDMGFRNFAALDIQITRVAHFKGIPVQELDDFDMMYEPIKRKRERHADELNRNLISDERYKRYISRLDEKIENFYNACPTQWHIDMMESYISGKGVEGAQKFLEGLKLQELLKLSSRNLTWLDRFEAAHQNYDRIFLIGGLAHFTELPPLLEPPLYISFPNMLEQVGYTVEPVTCEK